MDLLPVYCENEEFFKFLALQVESNFDLEIYQIKSFAEIKEIPNLGLKILVSKVTKSEIESLTSFLKEVKDVSSLLFVDEDILSGDVDSLLGPFYDINSRNQVAPFAQVETELLKGLKKLISFTGRNELLSPKEVDYKGQKLVRVRLERFLIAGKASADIFIQLTSGKFVKIAIAGDDINPESMQGYIDKGQQYLYQDKSGLNSTIQNAFVGLRKEFEKQKESSDRLMLHLTSIKQVQEAVKLMGVTPEIINFTDNVVEQVKADLKSNKGLVKTLRALFSAKGAFFTRASICNYLLGGIVDKMDWDNATSLKKLIYASVFCDFSFDEGEEELASILSESDPRYEKLPRQLKMKISGHTFEGKKLLEKSGGFLTDETSIVEQHHESPDGKGFPRGLNYNQIPPMSCAFILVYNFTQILIRTCEKAEDIDPAKVLEAMGDNYRKANFQRPYEAFMKVLKIH